MWAKKIARRHWKPNVSALAGVGGWGGCPTMGTGLAGTCHHEVPSEKSFSVHSSRDLFI